MNNAEFIDRLIALARARGEDAGPYLAEHGFEVYGHHADATHPIDGVYVWPSWRSVPTRIDPSAFEAVLARVESLPLDVSTIEAPSIADDMPGREAIVWCAVVGVDWAPGMPNVKVVSANEQHETTEMFYVLSLNHTQRSEKLIKWWGPNDGNYALRLEDAGRYTRQRIDSDRRYYDNGTHSIAIPCSIVDPFAVPVADVKSHALDPDRPTTDRVVRYGRLATIRKAHARLKRVAA